MQYTLRLHLLKNNFWVYLILSVKNLRMKEYDSNDKVNFKRNCYQKVYFFAALKW